MKPSAPRWLALAVMVGCCWTSYILEAAADLGQPRHPMLCVEGNPSQACMDLLAAVTRTGADIHYHGDYDWGGVRIANRVRTHCGDRFIPWRYNTESYQHLKGGHPLQGTPVEADWDLHLAPAMQTRALGFHEEQVTEEILEDFRAVES